MHHFRFALPLQLLLTSLIFIQPCQSKPTLGFIYDIQEIVNMVHSDIAVLIEETKEYDENDQIKVLQHFKNISLLVDQIEQRYANIFTKINTSIVDHRQDDETMAYEIESLVYEMQRISKPFVKIENLANYEISTLKSFIVARSEDSVINKAFCSKIVWSRTDFKQKYKAAMYKLSVENMCHLQLFPQHYIFSLYMDVALTDLKAYILIEYSMMMARVAREAPSTYGRIVENNHILIKNAMDLNDPRIWRCDPPKHTHKVTYDEITNLLQGYVENVVDLNTDGSCVRKCRKYENTTYGGCYDQEEFCSQQPRCSGRIYNCHFVDADMSVCQSPANSTRRYEYIEYANGQLFGERKRCQRSTNKVESWRRWLIFQCQYCFCLCDQPKNSDRYFNLRETMSDIADNKVVTGVRFVKKNRIFHLQIQQGQLMTRGVINESTLEWKPVDDYKITDPNVTAGVDYHMLNYEKRSLDLDHVAYYNDTTFIVTGVGFQMLDDHLNLKVHYNELDFEKGELVDPNNKGFWHFVNKFGREKLDLDYLDVPTRSKTSSRKMSRLGQYIDFVNTGRIADAAQTTIPFIDTQDVVSLYPMPLSGIGVLFKSSPGFGGYVTPSINNYDLTQFIPIAFHPVDSPYDSNR